MLSRSTKFVLGVAVAALTHCFPAFAQSAPVPPESEPDAQTEIEVRGKREIDKDIVSENILGLTRRIKVLDVVPRYFEPLCLQVTGPDMADNQTIADRIMQASKLADLDPPKPDCRVNALVIIVDDPQKLYNKMVSSRRDLIGGINGVDRDVHFRRLHDDLAAGKPAIHWNRAKLVMYGGIDYQENGVPVLRQVRATRIPGSMYRSKILSVIMFDSKRLAGASAIQLGDYAAMHLLANPNRNIDFEAVTARSILGLFAEGPDVAAEGLTSFDRAYLEGVYAVGRNGWRGKVTRAVLDAYEAQCIKENPDCQFLVEED